jgi:NadR type nicotinamide-nucleotide adenylyltransferase
MSASVKRIAILGAESTGKSTLAEALADHFTTLWVPEYLREFVDTLGRVPQSHEQLPIAQTQVAREDAAVQAARQAGQSLVFCDSTPLLTVIYSRHYFGEPDAAQHALANRRYDFTIVTAPDMPWVADGLMRESEEVRQRVHRELLQELQARGIAYLLVTGELPQRLRQVEDALSRLT